MWGVALEPRAGHRHLLRVPELFSKEISFRKRYLFKRNLFSKRILFERYVFPQRENGRRCFQFTMKVKIEDPASQLDLGVLAESKGGRAHLLDASAIGQPVELGSEGAAGVVSSGAGLDQLTATADGWAALQQ